MITKRADRAQLISRALADEPLDQRRFVVKAYRDDHFAANAYEIPCVSELDAYLMASDMVRIERWHRCTYLAYVEGREYVAVEIDGSPGFERISH